MAQHTSLESNAGEPKAGAAARGLWLGGIGLAAVVMMTWLPHSYLRMVSWPWALVWQVGFLAVGVWLLWLLRQPQVPFSPLGYGLDWAVGATGLGLVACSLASEFRAIALWNVTLAVVYLIALYAGAVWVRQTAQATDRLAMAITCTVLGTAIISLVLWRPAAASELEESFYTALRNAMPFGHHNFVGGYFALGLPFVVACALAFGGWRRWVAIAASGLTAIALYVSGSRGALLGVLVWLLGLAIAFGIGTRAKGRGRRLLRGGLGVGLTLAVALTNSRVRGFLGSIQLSSPSGFVVQDGQLIDRYFMAKTALNILRDRPLFGVGPGVMSRVSNLYRPIETGLGMDHVRQLHSTPPQLVGELGLLGLGLYLLWLVVVGRLGLRLRPEVPADQRWLLYGVGGSILAYGVSSLTDYQLENIGIASLLGTLVLVLLSLAREGSPTASSPLAPSTRRYLSLGLLAWLGLTTYLWGLADLGFLYGDRALRSAEQGDVASALTQLDAAAAFVPWDPTYPALAGQTIAQLLPLLPPAEQEAARQDAVAHYTNALALGPNDVWFNFNLANLLLPQDPAAAETYSRRSVQLLPRNNALSRYGLGQALLNQGKTEAAIAAFSLEGTGQPGFLTWPLWQQSPLAPLKDPVLDQALAHQEVVLAATPPTTPGYNSYYDQTVLVRWWHRRPLPNLAVENLSPLTQTLLAADKSPAAALAVVDRALAQTPTAEGLLLLRAWLNPQKYARAYFEQANLAPAEQAQLSASLVDNRDLRSWLESLATPLPGAGRSLLGLTYRNRYAQNITYIASAGDLDRWVIPELLGLFPGLPREFVPLDRAIEAIQTQTLGLPSAVHNNFSVVPQP
jgi:O-antigen ligase